MAASFSANYQSLSLTSGNSRSLSYFSLCNLHSIRARFLGCGHNLRPPDALRSRKKCGKLGLLVIAVTLSAVSLFYFGHNRRKRNAKQILGRPTFALSHGSNVGNQAIQTQILDFQEFQRDNSLKEFGLLEESKEHNHVFVDKEAQLPFWRSSVVHEEVVMTKTSDSSSEVLVSSTNASTSNDSKVVDQSFLPVGLPIKFI